MMERNELLRALRSTAADQRRCFGCGYEYKCSIRGCAINRAAAELIVQLAAEIWMLLSSWRQTAYSSAKGRRSSRQSARWAPSGW